MPRLFGRLLFPHFCVSCGDEGAVFCSRCRGLRSGPPPGVFACPSCGVATPFGIRCPARRCSDTALDGLVSAAPYADPVLRGLLRLYKYDGVEEARAELDLAFRGFLSRTRTALGAVYGEAAVEAVPLHFFRCASRGFNQSDPLADRAAASLGLRRSRGTLQRRATWTPQARIEDARKRKENMDGAFLADRLRSAGDWVAVDDVATSGATLEACATALKAAGARRVWGLTLLRG